MAQQLRARFDVIVVLEEDGQAVQYAFATNLRDQLELAKRFPKVAEEPGSATARLVYCAAQRTGCSPEGETFEAFVDRCLDLQLDEAPPLIAG
ncbi:MAG: hypothetical protein IT196_05340 [Acidimicrobiales bacterium]|nr:hypothetical protein [Acidimicrobiales bacterium]